MPSETSAWEVLALFLTGIAGIAGIAVATIGSLGYVMFSSVNNTVPEVSIESPIARWVQRRPPPDRTQLARYSDEQLEHLTINISHEWAKRFQ